MSADFLDSNVFVYLFDEAATGKRPTAHTLVREALESGRGVISFQVVQETPNVLTRKLAVPLAHDDALIVAAALEAGSGRLLSEDLQDGQTIEGVAIVNPFRSGS